MAATPDQIAAICVWFSLPSCAIRVLIAIWSVSNLRNSALDLRYSRSNFALSCFYVKPRVLPYGIGCVELSIVLAVWVPSWEPSWASIDWQLQASTAEEDWVSAMDNSRVSGAEGGNLKGKSLKRASGQEKNSEWADECDKDEGWGENWKENASHLWFANCFVFTWCLWLFSFCGLYCLKGRFRQLCCLIALCIKHPTELAYVSSSCYFFQDSKKIKLNCKAFFELNQIFDLSNK